VVFESARWCFGRNQQHRSLMPFLPRVRSVTVGATHPRTMTSGRPCRQSKDPIDVATDEATLGAPDFEQSRKTSTSTPADARVVSVRTAGRSPQCFPTHTHSPWLPAGATCVQRDTRRIIQHWSPGWTPLHSRLLPTNYDHTSEVTHNHTSG
jgi:hypothetical protein